MAQFIYKIEDTASQRIFLCSKGVFYNTNNNVELIYSSYSSFYNDSNDSLNIIYTKKVVLDNNGNIIQENVILDSIKVGLITIVKKNNKYFIYHTQKANNTLILTMLLTDTNFHLLKDTTVTINNFQNPLPSIIAKNFGVNNNLILFTAISDNYIKVFKTDDNLNITNEKTMYNKVGLNDIHFNANKNQYAFIFSVQVDFIIFLNQNLDSIGYKNYPLIPNTLGRHSYYSNFVTFDNRVIFYNSIVDNPSYEDHTLYFQILDTNFNFTNQVLILDKQSEIEDPAESHNIEKKDSNSFYFIGRTKNLYYYSDTDTNTIILGRIDKYLSIKFIKYIKLDLFTIPYNIQFFDNSIFISADYITPENKTFTLIAKLDTIGNIESSTYQNIKVSDILVYPNPGGQVMNIENGTYGNILQLYNLNGQMIVEQRLKIGHNNINTSTLGKGVYIYKIINNGNITSIGKWVKI